MAFPLLWLEVFATSLLLLATLVACIGRLRRRRLRIALATLVLLTPLAAYTGLTILAGYLHYALFLLGTRFYPLLALTVCFLIGGLWVLRRGLRLGGEEPGRPAAASWPRGRLGIALGVAAALAVMTFWNLDLAARQRMEALRLEAGTLAMSVAPPRLADRDNAALVYQRAIEAMGPGDAWDDVEDEDWGAWLLRGVGAYEEVDDFDLQDAALREFLGSQSAVLNLLRQAAGKPGCWFDRDFGRPSYDIMLRELPYLRKGARLLSLDARCKASEGDMDAALADIQTMFRIAEHIADEPILVSLLASICVERLAIDSLQAVLASGQVSPHQLAVLDINPYLSYRRHFEWCLRMEEALMISIVCDVTLEEKDIGFDVGCEDVIRNLAPVYLVFMLGEDLAGLRGAMKEARHLTTEPYHQTKHRWESLEREPYGEGGGLFTRMLMPALGEVAHHVASADARRLAVLPAIAVQVYRATTGDFPESLEELTPGLIAAVPRDPFDGEPLRLRRIDDRLVVYSIGPDMVDNGGSPMGKDGEIGDIVFELADR